MVVLYYLNERFGGSMIHLMVIVGGSSDAVGWVHKEIYLTGACYMVERITCTICVFYTCLH